MTTPEQAIASHAAKNLAEKDWHTLSSEDRILCAMLEDAGYLEKKESPNGFVGKVVARNKVIADNHSTKAMMAS